MTGTTFARLLAVVSLLLVTPAAVRADQVDEIAGAIRQGDIATIRTLVTTSEASNQRLDSLGTTPLRLAVIRGERHIVSYLLQRGADIGERDSLGMSVLSAAVRSCRSGVDVIEMLIDAGADLENRSGAGNTPLMVAILGARPDVARLLIEHGADVAALNQYGDGVINMAIRSRMPEILALAVVGGAPAAQLKVLFKEYYYYFPNFGRARSFAMPGACGD